MMYENKGEFILFLNDDVELGNNFFQDLIKPFKDKSVAMVGCRESARPWGLNGAIMCIRREIFERIGGFDENYFFMWEDNDICENIKRRGYKIAISTAKAKHEGGASTKQSQFFKDNFNAGQKYYSQKWGDDRRIIGSMVAGNEEGRYMEMTIKYLFIRALIDELVIVLDGPTDNTPEIINKLAEQYPITIYRHRFNLFGHAENKLRERSIDYAISKNPYAIITPDADEIFDEKLTRKEIYKLLEQSDSWDFMIAHLWQDESHVRIDNLYGHARNVRLFRYLKDCSQKFAPMPIHCGSAPTYAYNKRKLSPFILKHYGYLKKEDIENKHQRYKKYDPKGLYESINWYQDMNKEGTIIEYEYNNFIKTWRS